MEFRSFVVCCLLVGIWGLAPCQAQEIELLDRDRVVFVGDGLIEHAQRFGYIEAALSAKWPDRKITFRNVGWSGDTVKGVARDHYTNPPTAYEHLLEQINQSDPTVLIMGYGGYLAFEDEAARTAFRTGYLKLLDDVGLDEKRCILLSSIPHEQAFSPVPDVAVFNEKLERANTIISEVAEEKGCQYIDLFKYKTWMNALAKSTQKASQENMTTNGVHLSDYGYATLAMTFRGSEVNDTRLEIDIDSKSVTNGTWVSYRQEGERSILTITPDYLPVLHERKLMIKGLRRGTYQLSSSAGVLGKRSHSDWEKGTNVIITEELEQADALRSEIIEKNALYFRQYRPQNETYLVGFRRYEQGQNAVELDQLNPLIFEKENEIGRLKVPQPITLIIERL